MNNLNGGSSPYLVVLTPESDRGRWIPLHGGEVLTFGSVTARLEYGGVATDRTSTLPRVPSDAVTHHVGTLNAGAVTYADYVQNINQQRESFLREVAATKSRARWLAWTGFLLSIVGFGIFAAADLSFIKEISDAIQHGTQPSSTVSPFGREIGGIPFGLVGWGLAVIGMVALAVGIVLHVVAAARGRRAYRDFRVLPPGRMPGLRGGRHEG